MNGQIAEFGKIEKVVAEIKTSSQTRLDLKQLAIATGVRVLVYQAWVSPEGIHVANSLPFAF